MGYFDRIRKGDKPGHPFRGNQWTEGQTARFSGSAADGKASGDFDVAIVNPHSNADKVTQTDASGRQYEGSSRHLPLATVMSLHTGKTFEANHHSLKPAELYEPRLEGEGDKAYAKRVVDKMPAPKVMPEDAPRYFNMDKPGTHIVPLDQLVSTKTDEENKQGGGNGAKRMLAAYLGKLGKRDPISVKLRADGKYDILDGNGTYTCVKQYGWKALPVEIVQDVKKYSHILKADWKEELHPRDATGKFTEGGAGSGGAAPVDDRTFSPPASPELSAERRDMKYWVDKRNVDIKAAEEEWKALSPKDKDTLGNVRVTVPARMKELLGDADWPQTGSIEGDTAARIEQYKTDIIPESRKMIGTMVASVHTDLKELGVTDEVAATIVKDVTDHIIAQEMEAQGRILGDHGAHHLYGNMKMGKDILAVLPGDNNTPESRLAMAIGATYHDIGYLTPPARNFFDREHVLQGQQYYEEHVAPMLAPVLGKDWSDRMANTIGTHDTTELNWDIYPERTAMAVADNLALFHKEKMPPMLRSIPEATKIMVALGRGKDNGGIDLATAKQQLTDHLEKSDKLTGGMRERFKAAIGELNVKTPNFTLGMVGASLDKVSWEEGHLAVDVVRRNSNEALGRVLDLGQKSFKKLAEQYGKTHGGEKNAIEEFLANKDITFQKEGRKLMRVRVREVGIKEDGTEYIGNTRFIDLFPADL